MLIKQQKEINKIHILTEIRFGFLSNYKVAGMGEPWLIKLEETHRLLYKQNIGAIVTLTEEDLYGIRHVKAGFLHHHEPIDDCEPPDFKGMDRIIRFIDNCLEKGYGVAVHCLEGRGRTATVLAVWLGLKENLTGNEAVKRIHELRYHTILTPSQKKFIKDYLKG